MKVCLVRLVVSVVTVTSLITSFSAIARASSLKRKGPEQPALLVRAGTTSEIYLVASTGCVAAKCLRIYRTTIDASHFVKVSAPPVEGEKGGIAETTLVRLVFANADDGYAEVGSENPLHLYATANGARSWRQVTLPPNTDLLSMDVSSNALYATTARCSLSGNQCNKYRVWRTSLSAKKWTLLPRLWVTGTGPKDNYYGPLVSVKGNTVWEVENGYKSVHLWTSHDAGRTFSRISTPALASVAGCYLTPMTNLDIWAECPTGMEVSFLYSHDGGARWGAISRDVFSGTGGGTFEPVSSELAYLDYGLVNVKRYNLFRISDGGMRASAVDDLACTSVSLLFTNTSDGLADCAKNYTSSRLERTNDGGSSWRRVSLP